MIYDHSKDPDHWWLYYKCSRGRMFRTTESWMEIADRLEFVIIQNHNLFYRLSTASTLQRMEDKKENLLTLWLMK